MRKAICQCISNITISITDRQMMNSVTGFLSFDLADPIPYRFNRYLRIHLGNIISPKCLHTVSDISASLSPSNAISIQVTLGWFTFEPLKGPVALFDCIFSSVGKPWFIETFQCRQPIYDPYPKENIHSVNCISYKNKQSNLIKHYFIWHSLFR